MSEVTTFVIGMTTGLLIGAVLFHGRRQTVRFLRHTEARELFLYDPTLKANTLIEVQKRFVDVNELWGSVGGTIEAGRHSSD